MKNCNNTNSASDFFTKPHCIFSANNYLFLIRNNDKVILNFNSSTLTVDINSIHTPWIKQLVRLIGISQHAYDVQLNNSGTD